MRRNACKWLLDELLVNFPFVDTASRHNALAGILTAIIRSTLDGIAPLFLIDATVAGTGKSLVTELVSIIATGRVAVMGGMPDREDEFAKALTSSLLANPTGILIFDNIAGSLASPTLARALTASTFSERLLGSNRKADIQHRACFFANGNNVDVRGDIGRRVCYSRMDAGVTDPHKRGGFRHEDIKAWAHSNRGLILAKLLTMCKAWHVAGRPAPKNLVMGSFERWIKTVGGIMQFAGASEFMRNADEFLESSDSERDDWEGFLARLFCLFRKSEKAVITRQFTVKEVMDKTRTSQDLSEVVPGCMADYLERGLAGKKSIGKVFSYRKGRRFGKQGLRLVISTKASPARWVIQSDSPVVLGDYTDPDGRGKAWGLTPIE